MVYYFECLLFSEITIHNVLLHSILHNGLIALFWVYSDPRQISPYLSCQLWTLGNFKIFIFIKKCLGSKGYQRIANSQLKRDRWFFSKRSTVKDLLLLCQMEMQSFNQNVPNSKDFPARKNIQRIILSFLSRWKALAYLPPVQTWLSVPPMSPNWNSITSLSWKL